MTTQTSSRQNIRDLLALSLLLAQALLLLFTATYRARLVDNAIGVATSCPGCFYRDVLLSDTMVILLILTLLALGLFIHNRLASTAIRLLAILVSILYILDTLLLRELSSRLLIHDLLIYSQYLYIIRDHLHSTGFFSSIRLLAIGVIFLLFSTLLIWPTLGSRYRPPLTKTLLASLLAWPGLLMVQPQQYVHGNIASNIVQINTNRGELTTYSKHFISRFAKQDATVYCQQGEGRRDNLIILILESWSPYHSLFFSGLNDWTPGLDAWAKKGHALRNLHAAGFTTNEGLMSLLGGMEVLATQEARTPFVTMWGHQRSLPAIVHKHGYRSSFLTTGDLEFSGKQGWLQHLGFDHIEGHNHPAYDDSPRFHFGAASDEKLYQRTLTHLDELQENASSPYLIVVETVSSHHPYIHPHTGETSSEAVFRYMDESAASFIGQLEERGFFANGRLLVVSDHRAMVPVTAAETRTLGRKTLSLIPGFWLGKNIDKADTGALLNQASLLDTVEHSIAGEYCTPRALSNMLAPETNTAQCIFHARGDDRALVNVFCPQGEGTIRLAGDKTRFVDSTGINTTTRKALIDWLNGYRILQDQKAIQWRQQTQ